MDESPKIGSLIPIRLASERLPSKAIMNVKGKPLVCHLLDRIFESKYIKNKSDVIVCTTKDSSDDLLEKIVKDYGGSVYRGDTNDIIKRFYGAIKKFNLDYIIQVDGDDIFTATEYMDATMDHLLKGSSKVDIVTVEGLPLGIASKSFTKEAMEKVYEFYRTKQNDTGFIYFFTKTGLCNHEIIKPLTSTHILEKARLTLDYQVDLEVFRIIIDNLYDEGKPFPLSSIVRFLKENPNIMEINSNLDEEYWQRTRDKAQLTYKDNQGETKKILL